MKIAKKTIHFLTIVVLCLATTSIFASLAIYTFLGHVSKILDIPIEEIPNSGEDLAFIAYPALITLLKGHNAWALLFFFMLLTIGMDSVITQ